MPERLSVYAMACAECRQSSLMLLTIEDRESSAVIARQARSGGGPPRDTWAITCAGCGATIGWVATGAILATHSGN